MLFDRLIKFFSSLRLTVVLLALAIILVFVGTVAQADEGLYAAQSRYFKQWIVWGITMFGHRVPAVLPGGYLIGSVLLINLIAAHACRFQFTLRKSGIHLAHAGVILLLVGQLFTDMFSRETEMRLAEGEKKSFAESGANFELVLTTSAGANENQEIAIPMRRLARGGEITSENLPCVIRIKDFWRNSRATFRAPMMKNGRPLTTNGIATSFDFAPVADARRMDDRNAPTAVVELVTPNGSLGTWVASAWAGDAGLVDLLRDSYTQQAGPQMAQNIIARLVQPQAVTINGKTFALKLRPERIYMPFSLTLLKATHSNYPGSETPKDFRSRVRLENAQTGENREVEIYMNNPLRYGGLTFYQYQMDAGDATAQAGRMPSSVLQVVRNPSWLTPYVGCVMVAVGLVIQFMIHLVGFLSRKRSLAGAAVRAPAPQSARAVPGKRQPLPEGNIGL
jgi:hypothetical protein